MKLHVWNWRAGEEPLTRGRNEGYHVLVLVLVGLQDAGGAVDSGSCMAMMLGIIKPQPNPPSQGQYGSVTSPPSDTQAHTGTEGQRETFRRLVTEQSTVFTIAKSLWIAILEVKLCPLWSHFGRFLKLLKAFRGARALGTELGKRPPAPVWRWVNDGMPCTARPGHRG